MVTGGKSAPRYRRLPGLGFSLTGGTRLFAAEDHLLLVQHLGYTERYKRFYFADIQAFTLRRTATWKVLAFLFGLAALPGLGMLASSAPGVRFSGALVAGLALLALVINWIKGPSCVTYIHTAVQREKLSSLGRLRTARAVIETARGPAESVQGALTIERIRAALSGTPARKIEAASPGAVPESP